MHYHVSIVAVLSALVRLASAECCTVDDPIGPFRTCSPVVAAADTPFLVKAINYTRYHDDLGGGTFDPDERWDSVAVWLARQSNRVCPEDETFCVVSGPVCKLIDCFPLSQDASRATNNDGTLISDFVVSIPGGAGPNGAYYDLASSLFDRHDGSKDFTKSVWRTIPYASNASSLEYDNNWRGFNMTGTENLNGTNNDGFYPFEVADSHSWPSFDLLEVPCSAYACARRCVHEAWSGTSVDVHTAKACIDNCEGVDDVVNYCPDVGGEPLTIDPKVLGLSSEKALEAYLPDGCVMYEGAAFPEAHASYVASTASASSAAAARTSTSTTAHATASSGAISGRREAAKVGAVLAVMPIVVKVIIAV
ncbi:hypothetical protein BKA67DRAFT_587609 [Truncatella angustata]|uniref:Uncharacterized protein n=1 Tax=Truncatella angustata TaxID=152316 RepID=A0A9P8RKG8_9PEZI|nr:uncharacterized protein BKA67DRAFT_587609 [Truncatella angustata]KAH6643400.1 hypothetical protein BKA67DRAFT_587609 [Truncatella angustata]